MPDADPLEARADWLMRIANGPVGLPSKWEDRSAEVLWLLRKTRAEILEEAARLYEDTMPAVAAEIRALKGPE